MEKRTIIIFANSIKHNAHCVAGKCVDTGVWIRPVSTPQGGELSDSQVQYKNIYGSFPVRVLQKIEMQFDAYTPIKNQPENYLISNSIWQQKYKITEEDLFHYLDQPDDLWGEGNNVIYDFIDNGEINIYQSLYLIKVENLKLYRNQFQRKRALFTYNQTTYELAVTDPLFDSFCNGNRAIHNVLCISLGGMFQGRCYKLVAAIF